MSLEEVAKAAGKNLDTMTGLHHTLRESVLKTFNVPYQNLGRAVNVKYAVEQAAARRNGVILLTLKGIKNVGGKIEEVGHQIFLENKNGVVKFIDRKGEYDSLEALSKKYSITFTFTANPNADLLFIPNATVKAVTNGVANLFISVETRFTTAPGVSLDDVKKEYEQFKAKKRAVQAPPAATQPRAGDDGLLVKKGDTLSGFSMSAYGTFDLWPLLWDLNRQAVGRNPNHLAPGIRVKVPSISAFNGSQIADAKRRAPTWRNYPC